MCQMTDYVTKIITILVTDKDEVIQYFTYRWLCLIQNKKILK